MGDYQPSDLSKRSDDPGEQQADNPFSGPDPRGAQGAELSVGLPASPPPACDLEPVPCSFPCCSRIPGMYSWSPVQGKSHKPLEERSPLGFSCTHSYGVDRKTTRKGRKYEISGERQRELSQQP